LTFLIDTSIAIHARDGDASVYEKLYAHQGLISLSALSLVELQRGLYKDFTLATQRRAKLDVLLKQIPVLAFDAAAAEAYGYIIAALGWVRGRDFDRMIAAHAISTRAILITANEKDFRDVPGLRLENWLAA
jgi:tRNA(fMet)-specific endonuclease VapC